MVTLNQDSRLTRFGLSLGGVVITFVVWHLITDTLALIGDLALPSPLSVLDTTIANSGVLWSQLQITMVRAGIGYAGAVILALLMAVAVTANKEIRQAIMPLVLGANSVPRVSIAPLVIFYLGDFRPHALIAGWIAFFPILINTIEGLGHLDDDIDNLLDALGATRVQEYRYVRFPNALPFIFDGLKVGVSLAIVGAIVGEFVASNNGIGFLALFALKHFDTTLVFSVIGVMALIAMTLFFSIYKLQDIVVHWKEAALFPE